VKAGKVSYYQIEPKLIIWYQMEGSGLGKEQERA
jgi:hypothetical protein